jgi:hypothetical protein
MYRYKLRDSLHYIAALAPVSSCNVRNRRYMLRNTVIQKGWPPLDHKEEPVAVAMDQCQAMDTYRTVGLTRKSIVEEAIAIWLRQRGRYENRETGSSDTGDQRQNARRAVLNKKPARSTLADQDTPEAQTMKIDLPAGKIRMMATAILKAADGGAGNFTTAKAEMFLALHGEVLEERIYEHVREFIEDKLVGK